METHSFSNNPGRNHITLQSLYRQKNDRNFYHGNKNIRRKKSCQQSDTEADIQTDEGNNIQQTGYYADKDGKGKFKEGKSQAGCAHQSGVPMM